VGSSLRVLQLEITWEQLLKLFNVIQDLQYLHDLSLSIPISSTRAELGGNRGKAPALPQVQIFLLEMKEKFVGPQILDASDFAEAAHLVLDALDSSLPHVRTVRLTSHIYTNDLVRLVRTMGDLASLDIIWTVRNNTTERVTCPTLKTLRAHDQDVLRYLRMPNLTSITLLHTARVDEVENEPFDCSFASTIRWVAMPSKGASAVLANGGEFTQLDTIEWYNCIHGYDYLDGSFPSLTKIIFGEVVQGVNAFCELLLRYPRSCPRLEMISSRNFPEWDTLLYMLLRRNVHCNQNGISRIKRIEIPGLPAPSILVPLSALLLGKIPIEMPSAEELSLVGIEYPFFDRTVYVNFILINVHKRTNSTDWSAHTTRSGCASCIHCRNPCNEPITLPPWIIIFYGNGEDDMMARRYLPKGSDPPLSTQLQDWVDGWTERRKMWKQKESTSNPQFSRRWYCGRYPDPAIVVIDGYTLNGSYVLLTKFPWSLLDTNDRL
jgi:hypothetical protein